MMAPELWPPDRRAKRKDSMADGIDLTIRAEIASLPGVHDAVAAFAERHALPAPTAYVLALVVDELMTNSVEHGYGALPPGPVQLRLWREDGTVAGEIVDEGVAFDPTAAPEPDTTAGLEERAIGGLGVHLVRSLLDSLRYERRGGRNVLQFRLSANRTTDLAGP